MIIPAIVVTERDIGVRSVAKYVNVHITLGGYENTRCMTTFKKY
ncbi:hypothetical protein SAMN05192532_11146 [Alteribacillus iranensis]|uniref:Uncharacterized protein n=1 Tax=Alteribacillus iranensis TaxID=930128 RepID=A0A1I2FH03_9BACI|nr:hypothetical protein SAMN05192532_11146 [Alteribacillus iranensis]